LSTASDGHALLDQVDYQSVEPDLGNDRHGNPVCSPHERERARHDLVEGERDFEDVVSPALVGAQLQGRVAPAREREDGCMPVRESPSDDVNE